MKTNPRAAPGPAGHGPIIGLPSTKCVGEMRSGVGRPGSAAALETIEVLPPMIRRSRLHCAAAIAPSWHDGCKQANKTTFLVLTLANARSIVFQASECAVGGRF